MIDFKGKNALVTGSSRGVGQQIALGLAQLGCSVILHGRTIESCAQTKEMLKGAKVNVAVVYGELSDEAQVNQIIKQVEDLNVNIDILYNDIIYEICNEKSSKSHVIFEDRGARWGCHISNQGHMDLLPRWEDVERGAFSG